MIYAASRRFGGSSWTRTNLPNLYFPNVATQLVVMLILRP